MGLRGRPGERRAALDRHAAGGYIHAMNYQLSSRIQRVAPSATMAVVEQARQLRKAGANIIEFSAGQPDFDTPEVVKQAAMEALRAGDTKYPPAAGKDALREAVCGYLKRWGGLDYQPGEVCAAVGAKDALHLAFAVLVEPGDEVLIPAPYWVSYPEQVKLMGGEPVLVAGDMATGGKITPEGLRRAITARSRLLVLNSPNNPSGAVYTAEELAGLSAVVADSKLMVITDEIYHRLAYDAAVSASFAALPGMRERTITVNGCSKSFAMTGWRVGFAAGPAAIIDAMVRLIGQTTSGVASFIQAATIAALEKTDEAVATMREQFRARRDRMCGLLNEMPGVSCPMPAGAFYCFPDVSATFGRLGVADADGFAEAVLREGHVALVSGVAFGVPTHVRLSYATNIEQIEEGLTRMGRVLAG